VASAYSGLGGYNSFFDKRMQQLTADALLLKDKEEKTKLLVLIAQLYAKHQRLGSAYEIASTKIITPFRSQALYLILDSYYHPATAPTEFDSTILNDSNYSN
jgi:hypothetical protein